MLDFTWFYMLNTPPFTPQFYVFKPVWFVLYIMMILSLYFYTKDGWSKTKSLGIKLFFMQLFFNLIWAPVFFGLHNMELAFVIVLFMIVFVFATIFIFNKKSKLAAWLLVPYLIWIIFAAYLNYGFMVLN